jgi:hypothetical protein
LKEHFEWVAIHFFFRNNQFLGVMICKLSMIFNQIINAIRSNCQCYSIKLSELAFKIIEWDQNIINVNFQLNRHYSNEIILILLILVFKKNFDVLKYWLKRQKSMIEGKKRLNRCKQEFTEW